MEAASFAGLLGAMLGSFLNVVAYRVPRRESLVRPRSHCPACQTPLRPYDNVPVLSWLLLRGRCRSCGAQISPRYPIIEALTAVLCVGVVLAHDSAAGIALSVLTILVVVPVALIDLEYKVIPNRITAPAAVLALALGLALDPAGEPERIYACLVAGGAIAAVVFLYPAGMGMGDAKLVAVLGLCLGTAVAVAVLVGVLAGVVVGVAVMAQRGVADGRKTKVPFGTFLALGAIVAVYAGAPLVDVYTNHFLH
jgi:leader peptidase (prepilin peptidase)/N-methyltransferase